MTITFVGHGYVGLVTAAVFAELGNTVYVIGRTKEKIDNLKRGILPFFEPELEEMVKRNLKSKRLIFTLEYHDAVPNSDVVFIAVGTPPGKTGDAELSTVFEVAKKIGKNLSPKYTVLATKSTVPMGTNKRIKQIISEKMPEGAEFDIASVPEFLREGSAIQDTLNPDRIVIGVEPGTRAKDVLVSLHKPIDGEFVITSLETAELVKYASNSFLATKISFANAIAKLSELCGADGLEALRGIGLDKRIGTQFLSPGAGYGGSCFPKDVKALLAIAKDYDYDFSLLDDVERINEIARRDIVKKVKKLVGDLRDKRIALLGLSFKPNTDDMRDASSLVIIELLKKDGATIKAYDPQSIPNAKKLISGIEFGKDVYDTVKDADALVIVTDWNEFKEVDLEKIKQIMKSPNIVDGRNIYDPKHVKAHGFFYLGVGR